MPRRKSREWRLGPELYPGVVNIFFYKTGWPFIEVSDFRFPAINKCIGNGHSGTCVSFGSPYYTHITLFYGDRCQVIGMPRWGWCFRWIIAPPGCNFTLFQG